MIVRRRQPEHTLVPSPNQGVAFQLGLQMGRLSSYMTTWPRMARASIVIVGMMIAIPLFWLGRPGWAVISGFVALAAFWLTVSMEKFGLELAALEDQPKE